MDVNYTLNYTLKDDMSKKPTKATKANLWGRSAVIEFPESIVRINYGANGVMHWEVTDKEGNVTNGQERAVILQLDEDLYFLNWREKTRFTVSQFIDTRKGRVTAFWSYTDSDSQRRASMFVEGAFAMTGGAA